MARTSPIRACPGRPTLRRLLSGPGGDEGPGGSDGDEDEGGSGARALLLDVALQPGARFAFETFNPTHLTWVAPRVASRLTKQLRILA